MIDKVPSNITNTALMAEVLTIFPAMTGQSWVPLVGGRSNTLWRVGDIVVKQYAPTAASALFPNDPLAEVQALQAFSSHSLAPEFAAQGSGWLAYHYIQGETWRQDVEIVASLLGRLHQNPLTQSFRESPDISKQTLDILAECQSSFTVPEAPNIPLARQTIHGDAVAGNIICGTKGAVLIDWQCPAIGDPIEDIAIFLSPAMQSLYRGKPLTAQEKDGFLHRYPNPATVSRYHAMAPLLHARIAAHCLWKAERGNADYGAAFRLEQF